MSTVRSRHYYVLDWEWIVLVLVRCIQQVASSTFSRQVWVRFFILLHKLNILFSLVGHSASNLSSTSSSSASPSSSGFALNFSPYFNSPVHSDITIVVGEQRFFAHKLILCAHSDVFKKMLEGDWKEANNNNSNGNSKSNSNNGSSKNNESSSKVLTLSDINPNTFKHLLQFLYYGLDHVKIPKEDVTLVCSFVRFALPLSASPTVSFSRSRCRTLTLFL